MKVLYTSPILEYPAAGGPQLRIENSIKALTECCDCHVISRASVQQVGGKIAVEHYQKFVKHFSFSQTVAHLSNNRYIRGMQKQIRKFWANDAKFLVDYAQKNNIHIIWFGYGNLSFPLIQYVKQLAPQLKLICDTDSVWSRFLFRELPFIEDKKQQQKIIKETQLKEQEENAWVNLCDLTTAVSEVDAAYYRNLTQNKEKIALFSNVLDLKNYHPVKFNEVSIKKPAIYLAGSFGKATSAMNRAAQWLLNDILPRVRKSIHHIHCYIVGNYSLQAFGHIHDPHITVAGKVESVLPYLTQMDVALVPLQFESGTRFKILEAGACRVPIVSTTLGAEGLEVQHNQHLWIADDAQSFAEAIIHVISNPQQAQNLAQNCFEFVNKNYSLETLKKQAHTILAKVSA